MDGFCGNNSCSFSRGYLQGPKTNNCGSCCNCPGGHCPRMEAGGSGNGARGQSQFECPGGNCCPGGRCPAGKAHFNQGWQSGRR
ncbi:uncharacterized protein LOC108102480 [Drosophila eugracilis]|uniref:uncharacterized protein LOC108102480 n=1 Tax=Drosophila eugracilis TaxID=29029 RepID=UPI0007E79C29|nr:uncharacterized protein LOC108102480 [Drosophila eugracilis]